MRPWCLFFVLFFYQLGLPYPGAGAEPLIELDQHLTPGGLSIGKVSPDCRVELDGKPVRVSSVGSFLIGAGRDAKGVLKVTITCPGNDQATRVIAITERDYRIQRIDGLPPRKVEPNATDRAKIEADWRVLNAAKQIDSAEFGFSEPPIWPVVGPISGVFGSQRILNGKARSPHRGVDVAVPTGTPVGAMLEGVVTVARRDMYFTGGTVMVDHGHGLQSLYAHLSKVSVNVGQRLRTGENLGEIGATGRVTGPHLHLGLFWFETALDPALLLGPMPRTSP